MWQRRSTCPWWTTWHPINVHVVLGNARRNQWKDFNLNYYVKINTSPHHFVIGQHTDMKYLHSLLSISGFSHTRTLSYHTCADVHKLVTSWFENGTYGVSRTSKDIIFDKSCVFNKLSDNSPMDEEFAALLPNIENLHTEPIAVVKKVK